MRKKRCQFCASSLHSSLLAKKAGTRTGRKRKYFTPSCRCISVPKLLLPLQLMHIKENTQTARHKGLIDIGSQRVRTAPQENTTLFKQLQGSWPSSSPCGRSPIQCHTTTGVSLLRMQMQLPLSREKSLRLSGHQQVCQAPESQAFCDPVTANPSSFAALLSLQISIVFFFFWQRHILHI